MDDTDVYDVTLRDDYSATITSQTNDEIVTSLKVVETSPLKSDFSQIKSDDVTKSDVTDFSEVGNLNDVTENSADDDVTNVSESIGYDVAKTPSLLEFEPYDVTNKNQLIVDYDVTNKNQLTVDYDVTSKSQPELNYVGYDVTKDSEVTATSSDCQDSGVCSKSDSGDVIADQNLYDCDVIKREEEKSVSNESVVASQENLFQNSSLSRRSSFRSKIDKMMKRASVTSPPPNRRNSVERNDASPQKNGVSALIRQRLRVASGSSSEESVMTSQKDLREKLGSLLIRGDEELKTVLYDHQTGTKPTNKKPPLNVAKQPNKVPDDWRWRVLEHLRRKNVIPPLNRNNDVIMRSKTPAFVTTQKPHHQRMRPKSAMNLMMTSHTNNGNFSRSANDVTNYPPRQNVEVWTI